MEIEKITTDFMESNCYILFDKKKRGVLVDPGGSSDLIKQKVKSLGIKLKIVVNTHGHVDHILSNGQFYEEKEEKKLLPVYIHKEEVSYLTDSQKNLSSMLGLSYNVKNPVYKVEEGEKIEVGDFSLEVIHTPGHTPGSICLKQNKILLTGDTLFHSGVGRTDFPGSSLEKLNQSIKNKLFTLKNDIKIYPGHGPNSTIGYEKKNNPFVDNIL